MERLCYNSHKEVKNMSKILIVEDDESIALGCEHTLRAEGYEIFIANCVATAKDYLSRNSYDCLIIDLGLPDGNGFEVCKYAKEKSNPAIIFLTARDDENDIVFGLDMGGRWYPFRQITLCHVSPLLC